MQRLLKSCCCLALLTSWFVAAELVSGVGQLPPVAQSAIATAGGSQAAWLAVATQWQQSAVPARRLMSLQQWQWLIGQGRPLDHLLQFWVAFRQLSQFFQEGQELSWSTCCGASTANWQAPLLFSLPGDLREAPFHALAGEGPFEVIFVLLQPGGSAQIYFWWSVC